jgi:selenocysteine lyase/cysteine desulfurase
MIGIGHFNSVRPLMDLEIPIQPGVLRIYFLHYTSKEEINQLLDGLKVALDNLELN